MLPTACTLEITGLEGNRHAKAWRHPVLSHQHAPSNASTAGTSRFRQKHQYMLLGSVGVPTEPKRSPADVDSRINICWCDLSGHPLGQSGHRASGFLQKRPYLLVVFIGVPTEPRRSPADLDRNVNICWWGLSGPRLSQDGHQQISTEASIPVGGVFRGPD